MTGGDDKPSLEFGKLWVISGVFRSTTPPTPKAVLSVPLSASSVNSLASEVPTTMSGGVCLSPGKYSTPRVAGSPVGSLYVQISLPVVGSRAVTRP
jgi:hypothetical protein